MLRAAADEAEIRTCPKSWLFPLTVRCCFGAITDESAKSQTLTRKYNYSPEGELLRFCGSPKGHVLDDIQNLIILEE